MKKYQNILVAVELIAANDNLIVKKATDFAKEFSARLILLNVIERISSYGAAYGVAVGADVEQMLVDSAKLEMDKLSQNLNVREDDRLIKMGPTSSTILEEAEQLGTDLIILGSHGRHGLRLLLGSTANAVIHTAKCDVLAVRLRE